MIRWSFIYNDNHLAVEVKDEAEDVRISNAISDLDQLLFLPSQGKDAYVNLRLVKLVLREIVDEKAEVAGVPSAAVDYTAQDSGPGPA